MGLVTFSHLSDVCLSDCVFEMDSGPDPSQNLLFWPGAFCDGFLAETSSGTSGHGLCQVDSGWQTFFVTD